jgi:hypothetical protein
MTRAVYDTMAFFQWAEYQVFVASFRILFPAAVDRIHADHRVRAD